MSSENNCENDSEVSTIQSEFLLDFFYIFSLDRYVKFAKFCLICALTLPTPCISESYVTMKINFKFLFLHFFVVLQKDFDKAFIEPFDAPQRSVKIKI